MHGTTLKVIVDSISMPITFYKMVYTFRLTDAWCKVKAMQLKLSGQK